MTPPKSVDECIQTYDRLAAHYDERYQSESAHLEDMLVGTVLQSLVGRHQTIIDIGCGTGLSASMVRCQPSGYVGIDPSAYMLEGFYKRLPHLRYSTFKGTLTEWLDSHPGGIKPAGVVMSTFGSTSYLTGSEVAKLPSMATEAVVLMPYVPGYWPDYHEDEPETCRESYEAVQALVANPPAHLPKVGVVRLGNFDLVTLRRWSWA